MYTHTHKDTVCFTDNPPSGIYIYIYIYSVSPHRVKYLFYRTDSPPSCIYIYIHTYSVSPHRVNICFTAQMAQFYHTGKTNNLDGDLSITILYTRICTHTYSVSFTNSPTSYIYICTLFHYTELTSVLPHRLPSFTTLGKPTIWMVTYLSPSYTPICTRMHTYIPVVLQRAHHHIHIYIYTYMLCFTTQSEVSVLPHR